MDDGEGTTSFEIVGDTDIDLSQYITKDWIKVCKMLGATSAGVGTSAEQIALSEDINNFALIGIRIYRDKAADNAPLHEWMVVPTNMFKAWINEKNTTRLVMLGVTPSTSHRVYVRYRNDTSVTAFASAADEWHVAIYGIIRVAE